LTEPSADSCGWGVPFFDYKGERDQLQRWVVARADEEWAARRYEANAVSIDGLPGLAPSPSADIQPVSASHKSAT
jgi:hypothetical protein